MAFEWCNAQIGISLFVFYIVLSSDVFIKTVLGTISGAVIGRSVTSMGVVIQASLLVIFYFILGFLEIGNDS